MDPKRGRDFTAAMVHLRKKLIQKKKLKLKLLFFHKMMGH